MALILSLSSLILAFYYTPSPELEKVEQKETQDLFRTEDIIQTIHEKLPSPPPKPPMPIAATTEDDTPDDIDIEGNEIDNNIIPTLLPTLVVDTNPEPPPIFVWVENMPEPIGGVESIYENLIYPEFAVRAGIQGSVILEAVVNEDGSLSDISIVKGIGGGCEEAAVMALRQVSFNPGKQRGKAVKVKVRLPIKFLLEN